MGHLLSYRVGSLQKPHLPFARIAELGIQGLEMVWNEETTVDAVQAALDPVGLRIASIHAPAPMDDDDLPTLLGRHTKYATELGAAYLFVSVQAGQMAKDDAGYEGAYAMELEGGIFDSNQPDDLADKVSRCIAHLRQVGVFE